MCPFLNVTVYAGAVRKYRPQSLCCIFFFVVVVSKFPLKTESQSQLKGLPDFPRGQQFVKLSVQGALRQGAWALSCATSKAVWALEP